MQTQHEMRKYLATLAEQAGENLRIAEMACAISFEMHGVWLACNVAAEATGAELSYIGNQSEIFNYRSIVKLYAEKLLQWARSAKDVPGSSDPDIKAASDITLQGLCVLAKEANQELSIAVNKVRHHLREQTVATTRAVAAYSSSSVP